MPPAGSGGSIGTWESDFALRARCAVARGNAQFVAAGKEGDDDSARSNLPTSFLVADALRPDAEAVPDHLLPMVFEPISSGSVPNASINICGALNALVASVVTSSTGSRCTTSTRKFSTSTRASSAQRWRSARSGTTSQLRSVMRTCTINCSLGLAMVWGANQELVSWACGSRKLPPAGALHS